MILRLKGITTRTAGENLRQAEVFIHEDDSLPLDDDEYFIHELYTMQVVTVAGSIIGQVYDVLETGANNVLVVRREGDSDALIPMTHEVVQQIDRTAGRLIIQPLEGLFP
jgi:16S rRNA processing protein RimM